MLTLNTCSEIGAGGGAGDLNQKRELELIDISNVEHLIELCKRDISDQEARSKTIDLIDKIKDARYMDVPIATVDLDGNFENMPSSELVKLLAKYIVKDHEGSQIDGRIEAPSKCIGRGEVITPRTCPGRRQRARIIVGYKRTSTPRKLLTCAGVPLFKAFFI